MFAGLRVRRQPGPQATSAHARQIASGVASICSLRRIAVRPGSETNDGLSPVISGKLWSRRLSIATSDALPPAPDRLQSGLRPTAVARKSCDWIRRRVRCAQAYSKRRIAACTHISSSQHAIPDTRGRCEDTPEQSSPAGHSDVQADPAHRAGVTVLPSRCVRPKDTPQVLTRANHQSHSRGGVTGQPSDPDRLSLRERRPCEGNHGRT